MKAKNKNSQHSQDDCGAMKREEVDMVSTV